MKFKYLQAHAVVACIFVLVLVWLLASLPWISGQAVIGWDNLDYVYPQIKFIASTILRGEFPSWNPYSFGGVPVLSDPQGMLFTPHTLVAVIMGERYSIHFNDATTLLSVLLGSIALFLYTYKENGQTVLWALIAAVVFMLGGSATARLQHVPQIITYATLPIILLLVQKVCSTPTWAATGLLAAVLALYLINLNQVAFIGAFALAPLAILHIRHSVQPKRSALLLACASILAALAVLPVVVAMFETLSLTPRSAAATGMVFSNSLPPYVALGIAVDGLFGLKSWPSAPFWTPTDPSQDYLYVGAVPAVCLLAAIAFVRFKDAQLLVCLGMLVLLLLFSMGSFTPVFPFVFKYVPGFSFSRRPADAEYFVALFSALSIAYVGPILYSRVREAGPVRWAWCTILLAVAGLGSMTAWSEIHELATNFEQESSLAAIGGWAIFKIVIAVLAVAAVVFIRHLLTKVAVAGLLFVFVAADLISAARFSPFVAVPAESTEMAPLYRNPRDWRESTAPTAELFRFLEDKGAVGPLAEHRVEFLGGPLAVGVPLAFAVLNSQGYSPLRIKPYATAFGRQVNTLAGREFPDGSNYNDPLNRQLGLRWVIVYVPAAEADPPLLKTWRSIRQIRKEMQGANWAHLVETFGNYEVWELDGAQPRVVSQNGNCLITDYQVAHLTIECTSGAATRVVLNDTMVPGWSACVDGKPAPIDLYEGVFRSTLVPSGRSTVSMTYQSVPWLRWLDGCS